MSSVGSLLPYRAEIEQRRFVEGYSCSLFLSAHKDTSRLVTFCSSSQSYISRLLSSQFISSDRIRHEFIEKGKPQQNGFSISYTELSSEDIFLYYLNRWSIESYFKTAKQHFLQEFSLNSIFRYSGL